MSYIIKNITNKLDKRHPFVNTQVEIAFEKKNFTTSNISLNVGREILLEGELPISIHNLRIKGFISIKKISENELHAYLKKVDEEEKAVNLKKAKIVVETTTIKEEIKTKYPSTQPNKKKRTFSDN